MSVTPTAVQKVEYIWTKSKSMVTLIYLVLRYFGTIFLLYYTKVFLWDWGTSNDNQFYNIIFPVIELWPLVVEIWLVHVILQMRVYALYNRSKRVLFVVVLGFIIEVSAQTVSMIRLSIFAVNSTLNSTGAVINYPTTEAIDIYVGYSVPLLYELLLFSLALWAAIQSSCAANRIGAGGLRLILIEGNVVYFLV
ncbi:hypothetical protein V8B97DRAFT_1938808 [Scleroderma yunnanense]